MKNDATTLDGGNFMVRKFSSCFWCKHFHGEDKWTCEAYPNGIPSRFADLITGIGAPKQQIHTKIEEDQIGDFILTDE